MGCGEAVVDNGGSGGILANVDVDTGIVYTSGRNEKGERFLIHPDSKEQIVGFQIPRWKEAVAMVKEISAKTTNRYIGWDLALTEAGWVLVEGNSCGQLLTQLVDRNGILQEFLDIMES